MTARAHAAHLVRLQIRQVVALACALDAAAALDELGDAELTATRDLAEQLARSGRVLGRVADAFALELGLGEPPAAQVAS